MATARAIKQLINECDLSQRGAATALQISDRDMRKYCSEENQEHIPNFVPLALKQLKRQINCSECWICDGGVS